MTESNASGTQTAHDVRAQSLVSDDPAFWTDTRRTPSAPITLLHLQSYDVKPARYHDGLALQAPGVLIDVRLSAASRTLLREVVDSIEERCVLWKRWGINIEPAFRPPTPELRTRTRYDDFSLCFWIEPARIYSESRDAQKILFKAERTILTLETDAAMRELLRGWLVDADRIVREGVRPARSGPPERSPNR